MKQLTFCLLLATFTSCTPASFGSFFSIWSPFSGLSFDSLETHAICPGERDQLKTEIKYEVLQELYPDDCPHKSLDPGPLPGEACYCWPDQKDCILPL